MPDTATLSAKFQISIPKAVRTSHRWSAGHTFACISTGTAVLLGPVPAAHDLQGIAAGASPTDYRDRSDRT